MFRLVVPFQRFPSRLYSRKAPNLPPARIAELKDWKIIETSPGGCELSFVNKRTGEHTWYTPKSMSPAEILAVPGAWKYWRTVEDVECYIKEMEEDRAKNGGKDIDD